MNFIACRDPFVGSAVLYDVQHSRTLAKVSLSLTSKVLKKVASAIPFEFCDGSLVEWLQESFVALYRY
jgi:hypothetical protein